MTKPLDSVDKALAISLGLFILSAFFRGGNADVVVDMAVALAAVMFLALAWQSAQKSQTMPSTYSLPLLVAALALICVYGALGLVPLTEPTWLGIAGRAFYAEVLQTLSAAPFSVRSFALSIDPPGTALALMIALPCIAIAIGTSRLSEQRLRLLLGVFCGLAIGEALLGLLQLALGSPSFLAFGEAIGGNRAAGTFVNKNHFATLLAMALPLLIMRSAGRIRFGSSTASSLVRDVWWSIATAVVVAALVSSVSRAGTSAGALAGLLALMACSSGSRRASRTRIAMAILAVTVLVIVVPTGLSMLFKSVEGDALTQGAAGRATLNRLTAAAAREFFPVGAGLGSYSIAFQRFQTAETPGYVEHAHNDYLQLLFELGAAGLVVLALLAAAAMLVARDCLRTWRVSGRAATMQSACLLGVLAFSFHAWFDFPAHIPSLAWIVTLLAVAATRADMQMDASAKLPTDSHRRRKRVHSRSIEQTA